jgi:glutaminyl-tRNA synthetase
VVRNERTGEIERLHCTYDPATKSGEATDGRKVRGTLHWVSAAHAVPAEVRLFDYLLRDESVGTDGGAAGDFRKLIDPNSLTTLTSCRVEPSLSEAAPGSSYQFLRQGYFCTDNVDSSKEALVFNRTVPLKDTWAKIEKAQRKTRSPGDSADRR